MKNITPLCPIHKKEMVYKSWDKKYKCPHCDYQVKAKLGGGLLTILLFLIIFICFYSYCDAIEFTDYDPWYCVVEHAPGIEMPDKVAHFYRSYLGTFLIPWKVMMIANIAYEYWDSQRGIGYSWRDNIADFSGVISSTWFRNNPIIYLDWDSSRDNYMLKIVLLF